MSINYAGHPAQLRRNERSVVELTLVDGTELDFEITASPVVVHKSVQDIKHTGFLTLWNDTDTMCVPAAQLKYLTVREVK